MAPPRSSAQAGLQTAIGGSSSTSTSNSPRVGHADSSNPFATQRTASGRRKSVEPAALMEDVRQYAVPGSSTGYGTAAGASAGGGIGIGRPGASATQSDTEDTYQDRPRMLSIGSHDGPMFTSHAAGKRPLRGLATRAWILNPLSVPVSHPYLRAIATLLVWLGAIWTFHRYALPHHVKSMLNPMARTQMALDIRPPPSSDLLLSTHFPLPPARPLDNRPSRDPAHRPYVPLTPPSPPFPRLRATRFLPPKCMESWFAEGEVFCSPKELGEEDMLDVTWLWVNGSDTRWKKDLYKYREGAGIISPDHHFRENDELRFSMRSVLDALPGHTRTFHLILADSRYSAEEDLSMFSHDELAELEQFASKGVDGQVYDGPEVEGGGRGVRAVMAKLLRSRDAERGDEDGNAMDLRRANNAAALGISSRLRSWLDQSWRVVQTPTWLAFDRIDLSAPDHPLHRLWVSPTRNKKQRSASSHLHVTSHPSLRYAAHSEIFHLPSQRGAKGIAAEPLGRAEWREREWKEKALPTFNSMAIESRIGWLPGLGETSLACNDDFFLLSPHAVSDFHSPLYGSVIRLDHGYLQQIRPTLDPKMIADSGELGGLYHANWLLSQRFPRRLRPYFAHVPKVMSRSMHHEASIMFEHALTLSSQRRFRETPIGEGDVQLQWMITQMKIERWREALLWTYCVARLGSMPSWYPDAQGGRLDEWGDAARDEIRQLFGIEEEDDEDVVKIEVYRGERWTMEKERIHDAFVNAGWEPPKATSFLWSSLDGHLPPTLRPDADPKSNDRCVFDLERCFGGWWSRGDDVPADTMFKRLAFGQPACGDCLLMALVTASGPLGLSAVFPPAGATFKNKGHGEDASDIPYLPPPHLPLTPTWQEADFSLANVMSYTSLPDEEVNLRVFSMRLLSRYLYLSGKSKSHFHMMRDPMHAQEVFQMIDNEPDISILGLNDDIVRDYDRTRTKMIEWFEQRWPEPAVWEKDWKPTKK